MMLLRCSAIVAFALLLTGCVTEGPKVDKAESREKQVQSLVDLGVGYLRNGEFARAKENLNKALELNPKSALAHNTLALVFQLELEYEAAESHFKTAIKSDPSFTRARNNYGAFLYAQGRPSEAIEQLTIASQDRFYSARPSVFENLGVAYQQLGNMTAAEQAYERAVALNPEQPRSLIELASMRFEQQRYVEARELYRRFDSVAQNTARSLYLCVRIMRVFEDRNAEASCALALRNLFPASQEYEQYKELNNQ